MSKPKGPESLGAQFFSRDNPLNFLLAQDGAKLLVNPQVLEALKKNPKFADDLVAFMDPDKKGGLWPITLGKIENVVAVMPIKDGPGKVARLKAEGKKGKERRQTTEVGVVIATVGVINAMAEESLREREAKAPKRVEKKKPRREPASRSYTQINRALDVWERHIGSGTAIKTKEVKEGGKLLLFVNKKGREKHLIRHEMPKVTRWGERSTKRETLVPSTKDRGVVGIYLPPEKLDDPRALEKITRRLGKELKLKEGGGELAIGTNKQMELWRKYGFFTELLPHRHKEGAPSLRRVLGYLRQALGPEVDFEIKNLSNGRVDIVFVPKNAKVSGDLAYYDIWGIEKGKPKLVKNTAGIVCVENSMTDDEKKSYAKEVRQGLRLVYSNGPGANSLNVLTVNPELLEIWDANLKIGKSIATKSEIPEPREGFEKNRNHESPSGDVEDVKFFMFEPGPSAIGARLMQIVVQYVGGSEERVTLDMGAQYEGFPWADSLAKPSYEKGIPSFNEHVPFIPGLIDSGLLIKTAESRGAPFLKDINDPYLLDLFLRVGGDDPHHTEFQYLMDMYGEDAKGKKLDGPSIIKQLKALPARDVRQIGVVASHPHADHVDWMGLLSKEIPMIFADEAQPFFDVKFNSNLGGWAAESLYRRGRSNALYKYKKGTRISPPIHNPDPYKEILIGSGRVGITLLPVSHSIYGSTAVKVRVFDQFGKPLVSIGYTGDFNFDNPDLTERAFEEMLDVQYLITDTTNVLENSTKPSLYVTKEKMQNRFEDRLKGSTKTSVVGINWNNVGDIKLISDVARAMGKNVFVSPRIGAVLHQIQELDLKRSREGFGFDWRAVNPAPRLATKSPGIYPYMPHKHPDRYNDAEKMLMAQYPNDFKWMRQVGGNSLLMVPTNPNFYDSLATVNVKEIDKAYWATYWAYSNLDKRIVKWNYEFARKNGFEFHTDFKIIGKDFYPSDDPGYHTTGHATKEELARVTRKLFQQGRLGDGGVITVHGERRQYASDYLRKEAGSRGGKLLKVFPRVTKGGWELSLLKP